ncbi:hypothetical protein AB0P13_24755 [Rhodococcus pyridinivorans]|uniref:hypothetical protein n=1 Tax=Rhodococcus pyridinivorans TaxID=103816 RepID=UPI003441A161
MDVTYGTHQSTLVADSLTRDSAYGMSDIWWVTGDEDHRGAVDDGEFVVARDQSSPLLPMAEPAFDDVATPVVITIECWCAAAT